MRDILEIKDLNFLYDVNNQTTDSFVLRNVNLNIKEKDLVSIIGKNGSGKSTLIKLIARITSSDSGKIIFNGKDILDYEKKELSRSISYLPQSNDVIHFDSTVNEFLKLGRYPYKSFTEFRYSDSDKDEVTSCVKITGTESLLEKKMNGISGGERQKVLLTLSLIQLGNAGDLTGKLLIVDEPLTHLDINHQIEIMKILKMLNEKGLTVIIVIHDLNLALKYTSRSVLISNGKIVRHSETKEVITEEMLKEHFFIDSKILNYEKNYFINYLPD